MELVLALVAAAFSVGSIHTLAPDHWMPFAALARAERWSAARTASITALCGLGHVTTSVGLGVVSAFFGLQLMEHFGRRLESVAGFLLIAFGVVFALRGLHRSVGSRWHDHGHAHPHWHGRRGQHGVNHVHSDPNEGRLTAWTLFLLFSADPCVAVVPLVFAAVPLGWSVALAVAVAYEVATIGTMVLLVLPARKAVGLIRGEWADRYGDALAGGVIAAVGIAVLSLGL
jgi:nickel/cobalt transporter (NicO) family protein